MTNKCGSCLLFQGPGKTCGGGQPGRLANTAAPIACFKAPASFFRSKVCGGCRLFQGPSQVCGGGQKRMANTPAPSNCYSPIPG